MIIGIIITLFVEFLNLIFQLLPASNGLPTGITTSINTMWGYLTACPYFSPVQAIYICLGIVLIFEMSVLGFKAINWVIGKVRGSN